MSKNTTNAKWSLFMTDYISTKNTNIKGNKNNTLFIKGDKDITFELKKGYDSVYIIKTADNRKFEFDRNPFLETLKGLKKYCQVPIKLLEENQKDDFSKIVNALGMLHKTGKLYELIHNDVRNVFGDVKIIIPGTVAAYFVGCSSNDNFHGPMGCNPKCAASLAPGEKDPGDYGCDDLVLMYENDGTFSSLNQKISSHSYIFIGDIGFKGFTDDNVKQLRDANISTVTLIHGKSDGTYGDIISTMPLDNLPLVSQTQTTNDSSNDDNGAWILFIILIAIIIIILFIILYQAAKKNYY